MSCCDLAQQFRAHPRLLPSLTTATYLAIVRYVWTRDSSLVFQAIVDRFVTGNAKYAGYQTSIEAWIQSAATLQGVSNPSGAAYGDGLGE